MEIPGAARTSSVPREALPAHLRRDALFHGFIATYALAAFVLSVWLGVPHKFAPFLYVDLGRLFLAVVVGGGLWALITREPVAALRGAGQGNGAR